MTTEIKIKDTTKIEKLLEGVTEKDEASKNTWWARIERAKKKGEFSQDDRMAAANWVTCACGKLDPRVPRGQESKAPFDMELRELGSEFYTRVAMNNMEAAANILKLIDRAEARVLRELGYVD